ncbi:MAG TPA: 4-hydroxy-tetrahydrodipicolinate synthase, partial [Mycobacteriales bacterium]|nr:4-hydroxy-tetrahydrodipicolinate synthase [Mycobacteriales bacterium]
DGRLDVAGAQELAQHLVSPAGGNDGLVLYGTTGEAPTLSDEENEVIVREVRDAVGPTVKLIAGVGSNDTAHSIEQAQRAQKAGADGSLVVAPYYNRPPQSGLVAHVHAVADAAELPVMLYDIPVRSGIAFETETLLRLAEHPRIIAVKDAKSDIAASSEVIAKTDLAFYSGDDINLLPLLAVGGVGVVSVCAHVAGPAIASLIAAYDEGRFGDALALHQRLLPVFRGTFRTQGTILTKAALNILGLPAGPVRLPLVDATPEQIAVLRDDYAAGGVTLPA